MSLPDPPISEPDEFDLFPLKVQLDDLDAQILQVRFSSPDLSENEILSQLSELFDRRNQVYDQIRAVRVKKFKREVQALKLAGVQVQAVFAQSGCRCAFILQDPRIAQPEQAEVDPKKKGIKVQRHPWHSSRREFLYHRKADVMRRLAELKKQQTLSLQEGVDLKRFEWELQGILQELG
jgi:hypothetical protein